MGENEAFPDQICKGRDDGAHCKVRPREGDAGDNRQVHACHPNLNEPRQYWQHLFVETLSALLRHRKATLPSVA